MQICTILYVYNKLVAYYLKYETLILKSLLGASFKSHGAGCNTINLNTKFPEHGLSVTEDILNIHKVLYAFEWNKFVRQKKI